MEAKYTHKTEQFGASYDTDYKVITQCTPDCPACAYDAGRQVLFKEVMKWLDYENALVRMFYEDQDCEKRWQAKLKEWGIE